MSSTDITYVMGQLNVKIPSDQIQVSENATTGNKTQTGKIKLWTLHDPIIINLRFNSLENCPYHPQTKAEAEWLTQQLIAAGYVKNNALSTITTPPSDKYLLSPQDILYFKTANPDNPNATLFIHGYNVGYGDYSGQIVSRYTGTKNPPGILSTAQQVIYANNGTQEPANSGANKSFVLEFSHRKATVHRDLDHVKTIFGSLADSLDLSHDQLNGTEAQNWWLYMEHNMNRAAGFQGFEYFYNAKKPQYTRMIHIAWSGNPSNPLDYIAVEPIASITGLALVPLLRQLKENNIEINVVAHSAGNIVLIRAMHELGKHLTFKNSIENVFMWEPAMPDMALSPHAHMLDKSLTGYWKTQHAHQTAKKIFVLYSNHDNILGPIPLTKEGKKNGRLIEKIFMPNGEQLTTPIELFVDVFGEIAEKAGVPNALNSAYHIAQMFGVPFSTLIASPAARSGIYEKWYQLLQKNNQQLSIKPTLAEQILVAKKEYPHAFNDISAFIGLYVAIINDGVLDYLKELYKHHELMNLIHDLNPTHFVFVLRKALEAVALDMNHEDRMLILHKLAVLCKKNKAYKYLYKLALVMLERNKIYLTIKDYQSKDFFIQKTHDFILHTPELLPSSMVCMNVYFYKLFAAKINRSFNHTEVHIDHPGVVAMKTGEELAVLMITIFNTPGAQPRPAMGYSGPMCGKDDPAMQRLINEGKIILVDQSKYFLSHNAMKIPSDEVFENTYKKMIMQKASLQFGRFPRQ